MTLRVVEISGGRLWNTTCEKYSSNVVRCRAEIWATTVRYVNGRYVQEKRWVFNNLSYLPSPRASWANNNLGRSNPGWTSGGRQWKTECDTATTGRGGCRSYVLSDVVRASRTSSGWVYSKKKEWVFNNLVLFSSSSIPAVNKVPAWIIDQSRLDFTGLGPLQVGTSMKDLTTLGYFFHPDECQTYGESKYLKNRGIEVRDANTGKLDDVNIGKKGVKTVDGAQVGMTYAEVKGIYGSDMILQEKYDEAGDSQVLTAVVESGGNELVFSFDVDEGAEMQDSNVIEKMVARKISSELHLRRLLSRTNQLQPMTAAGILWISAAVPVVGAQQSHEMDAAPVAACLEAVAPSARQSPTAGSAPRDFSSPSVVSIDGTNTRGGPMKVLRKFAAAATAALVMAASGLVTAQADSTTTPGVYTTPGGQISGGRLWNTTCEMYSSNVVRCRTHIWATQVRTGDNGYRPVTGWVFNNLTYLPSPRATWAGNNLGQTNEHWQSSGRSWKTVCDTPATGRGGCRSYVYSQFPAIGTDSDGKPSYFTDSGWVFNNIVLFSSPSIPARERGPGMDHRPVTSGRHRLGSGAGGRLSGGPEEARLHVLPGSTVWGV